MYCEQITEPRGIIYTHISMLTSYVFLPIFIQIVNVLNLQFHGSIGATAVDTGQTDDTNRNNFKGCQEWSWSTFRKYIYQGVLTYSLIISEIQRISFSPIALVRVCTFVRVCVCLCVCVCVCSSV